MNCEAVKELLWAYLEKETTAEEAEKIEEHLKHCADCREELELQKEMQETLAGLPEAELPEGYHAELMQKLRAEAAPNVIPFPQKTAVKKKKQPMYKQWGMIAAAVLVVVAAGGMNGMLDMRESQNAAVAEMKAADTVAESSMDDFVVSEETGEEPQVKTAQNHKNAPAAGLEVVAMQEESIAAYDGVTAEADSADEEMMKYSVVRSVRAEANDMAELHADETAVAMAELQKAVAEAGGYEEPAEEGSLFAVIPVENYEGFVKAVEKIGTLTWTQKGKLEPGAAFNTVEIVLKNN